MMPLFSLSRNVPLIPQGAKRNDKEFILKYGLQDITEKKSREI